MGTSLAAVASRENRITIGSFFKASPGVYLFI